MMISRISHINSKNALRRVFCGSDVGWRNLQRATRESTGTARQLSRRALSSQAENLIFYSIEQKGLFTDPGRRADSPQSTPMGSRCLLFLLSVNACGSSQGESRRNVISNPKKAKFALRERFQVSGVEICPGVVKVDESVLFCFQSFSSYFPVIYQTFYKNLFPVRYHVKRLEKDCTFHFSCVILEKTKNPRR